MNDIKVMNHAADNIRILAASMVEKLTLVTQVVLWVVQTSSTYSSLSSWYTTHQTQHGQAAIVSSSILVT